MSAIVVAGDIGGTNSRFRLIDGTQTPPAFLFVVPLLPLPLSSPPFPICLSLARSCSCCFNGQWRWINVSSVSRVLVAQLHLFLGNLSLGKTKPLQIQRASLLTTLAPSISSLVSVLSGRFVFILLRCVSTCVCAFLPGWSLSPLPLRGPFFSLCISLSLPLFLPPLSLSLHCPICRLVFMSIALLLSVSFRRCC